MTQPPFCCFAPVIIPYQELLGNYDNQIINKQEEAIIPYQELLGNYDAAL